MTEDRYVPKDISARNKVEGAFRKAERCLITFRLVERLRELDSYKCQEMPKYFDS